jgi:hypothetical protein
MIPERPNPTWCRERAASYARHAEETASAQTAAVLHYLAQMWLVIAEVTDAIEGTGSRPPFEREARHLSAD